VYTVETRTRRSECRRVALSWRSSAEFLSESDEKALRPANVAEPIRVLIPNYFAYQLRATLAKPFERLVDVVNCEHDAQVTQSVYRGVPMIGDGRGREKPGEFEPAVAVRRAHHGNLDALAGQSSDTSGPFSFDRGLTFELEAELAKEINRRCEVIDDDSYVVHPFKRHMSTLQGGRLSTEETVKIRLRRQSRRPKFVILLIMESSYSVHRLNNRAPLVPPKPKEFDMAYSTSALRHTLGM
jgi:hypothetical protein